MTESGDNITIPTEILESMGSSECKIYVTEAAKASYQDYDFVVVKE